jgi:hypothetical protein
VSEQQVVIDAGDDGRLEMRRIVIELDEPTSDGEREIHLLTNLPAEVSACCCAQQYHVRWSIEALFGELTLSLSGEINTLCYPPAALLAYAIALVTYNLLAVVKGAMAVVHGTEKIDQQVSTYYLAGEVSSTWQGLQIAIPDEQWRRRYADLAPGELAAKLVDIARHTHLRHYQKHPRGPKKKQPPRRGEEPHISTARLLAQRKP